MFHVIAASSGSNNFLRLAPNTLNGAFNRPALARFLGGAYLKHAAAPPGDGAGWRPFGRGAAIARHSTTPQTAGSARWTETRK